MSKHDGFLKCNFQSANRTTTPPTAVKQNLKVNVVLSLVPIEQKIMCGWSSVSKQASDGWRTNQQEGF